MKRTVLTIYKHPLDAPDKYVVRGHRALADGTSAPERHALFFDTLAEARAAIPANMVCLGRELLDDPVIVESWI